MGNLRVCFVVALAACGGSSNTPDAKVNKLIDAAADAKVFEDAPIDAAPVYDFSCSANPAPTTANATVSVSGTIEVGSISGIGALSGAVVDACQGDCTAGNLLAGPTTSGATGTFMLTGVATGGVPLTAYAKVTATGDRTALTFPATPIVADVTGVPVLTFSTTVVGLLSNVGCTQNDDTNGMLGIGLTDCQGTTITDTSNVVLSIKQGTASAGDPPIDVGSFPGFSAAAGFFLVCNVPAGTTTVGATYKTTTTLLAHDVLTTVGTTTETRIRPGY